MLITGQIGSERVRTQSLSRFIKPAARKLKLDWVNWRSLRTSHAVWLKLAGADVKDAQGQMRHSRASTTLDIYQQFVPESQMRVAERLGSLGQAVNRTVELDPIGPKNKGVRDASC
jgi:integrase